MSDEAKTEVGSPVMAPGVWGDFAAGLGKIGPVGIADRSFFAQVTGKLDSRSCETAFANLIFWRDVYDEVYAQVGGRLVIFERKTGVMHFPLGEYLPAVELRSILEAGAHAGLCGDIIYDVPEDYDGGGYFTEAVDEGEYDYIYDLRHMAELSGSLLRKKRNLIHQLERNSTTLEIETVNAENIGKLVLLARELNSGLHQADFLGEEDGALGVLEDKFADLAVILGGIMLKVDGEYAGFSLYSRLNSDTADIHFEKARHDVKGAPQMLTKTVADQLLSEGYIYMNREQDMGEESLRQAKRSWDPCMMLKRKRLWRKN